MGERDVTSLISSYLHEFGRLTHFHVHIFSNGRCMGVKLSPSIPIPAHTAKNQLAP